MKTKKILAVILMVILVFTSFAGCGGKGEEKNDNTPTPLADTNNNNDNQDKNNDENIVGDVKSNELPDKLENPNISIVYWYNRDQYAYDTKKNENVYDCILETVPEFEEKYGGKVNVIYAAWDSMLETVIALQNSGDAPDLFEVYDRNMYNVIFANIAQPLSSYVTDTDYSYWDVSKDLFSWREEPYAIPIKPYTNYIMFNKDLFDWEGLTYPDELFRQGKWTFDEFEKAVKALTNKVDGEVTQYGFGSWQDVITSFMYANNGALYDVDTINGKVSSLLSTNSVQNTIAFIERCNESFIYGYDMYGWWDMGTLGMIRGKEFPVDHPFEVGMVPFPVGPDADGKKLVVFPQAFAVPTGAKNPEGAVAFMRMVNENQLRVGNEKEAERIGQDNYDMIYADDVELVYAYDKTLDNIDEIIGSIINYINDSVPASTIAANMDPILNVGIELIFDGQ